MDKEEIATPARISKWEYLKPISNEIVQDEDIVVGLLIGKLHESLRANKDNIKQGRWSLYIQDLARMVSISCHQVVAKDVTSSRLAPHHFGVEKSIKDISLEEMFKMMYSNDFNEHDAN